MNKKIPTKQQLGDSLKQILKVSSVLRMLNHIQKELYVCEELREITDVRITKLKSEEVRLKQQYYAGSIKQLNVKFNSLLEVV